MGEVKFYRRKIPPVACVVTDMERMFVACDAFNQPLNNWNTAAVATMQRMFAGCAAFNQPLNNWNTAAVFQLLSGWLNAVQP